MGILGGAAGPVSPGGGSLLAAPSAATAPPSPPASAAVGATSIAFPAISCGVYRFPVRMATQIALSEVRRWQKEHDLPETVIFCCFTGDVWMAYEDALA